MKAEWANMMVFAMTMTAAATMPAEAAIVTAPTQVVSEIEQHADSHGDLNNAYGIARVIVDTQVNPTDTFTIRIAAPAGKRFAYTPTVAPENTNNLYFYLAIPEEDAGVGTWSTASIDFDFIGLQGSLTGTQSLTMETNGGRTMVYNFENLTQAFTFEAIDLTFAVPDDAVGPLLVEYGDMIGEKFNFAGDAGVEILDMDNPVLTVVPEPGTMGVVLIGSIVMLARRRRG